MRTALAALLLLAVPATAAAAPREGTVGVTLGWVYPHDAADGESTSAVGLWGRLRLTPRLSGQLELGRVEAECDSCGSRFDDGFRSGTALLVVELADAGRWMPLLYVGAGLDDDGRDDSLHTAGHHIEGGFGVEYRGDGGFVLGADARMGGRSIDQEPDQILAADGGIALDVFAPSALRPGEYRSLRVTAGLRF